MTSGPKAAMVLAAGVGKRMRPLTKFVPKPLLRVGGRTMLDRTLDKVAAAGVTRAVVNAHYLADQIETHLKRRSMPSIILSPEEDILDTGGGVLNALEHLGPDPFFALNGDTVWDEGPTSALCRLSEAWDADRMDAILLMQPAVSAFGYDGKGDFHMDVEGRLSRRGESDIAPFVFTGIQILDPTLFKGLKPGRFSLNVVYDRALENERLFGIRHDGGWYHVGTPESLIQVNRIFEQLNQAVYF
ncbi:MAG: nucleotidyltransferase family protein [Rhodospirillaceae bacterium]|nr:nucleotidyltransferase family protein [Rhodospirillaceae bacterium]MCY4310607.1 nucleotidyltransferase family protein [Rhodospirillaceae bacterium]